MSSRIGMIGTIAAVLAAGGNEFTARNSSFPNREIEPGFGGSWPVTMPKTPPRVKKPRGQKRRHGRS